MPAWRVVGTAYPEPSRSSVLGTPYGPSGATRVRSAVPKKTEKHTARYLMECRAMANCGISRSRRSTAWAESSAKASVNGSRTATLSPAQITKVMCSPRQHRKLSSLARCGYG